MDIHLFKEQFTSQKLLTIRMIQIAILFGASAFFAIICFLPIGESSCGLDDMATMKKLSVVHIFMSVGAYFFAIILFGLVVNSNRVNLDGDGDPDPSSPYASAEEKALTLIISGMILRMALLEGVAFFGLVICLIGKTNGCLEASPVYWLNSYSYVILLLFTLSTFATKQRIENIFRDRFLTWESTFTG